MSEAIALILVAVLASAAGYFYGVARALQRVIVPTVPVVPVRVKREPLIRGDEEAWKIEQAGRRPVVQAPMI